MSILDLTKLPYVHGGLPKGYAIENQYDQFFMTQERAKIMQSFAREIIIGSRNRGLVISGPNSVGKSELVLDLVSMTLAARRPVVYIV